MGIINSRNMDVDLYSYERCVFDSGYACSKTSQKLDG